MPKRDISQTFKLSFTPTDPLSSGIRAKEYRVSYDISVGKFFIEPSSSVKNSSAKTPSRHGATSKQIASSKYEPLPSGYISPRELNTAVTQENTIGKFQKENKEYRRTIAPKARKKLMGMFGSEEKPDPTIDKTKIVELIDKLAKDRQKILKDLPTATTEKDKSALRKYTIFYSKSVQPMISDGEITLPLSNPQEALIKLRSPKFKSTKSGGPKYHPQNLTGSIFPGKTYQPIKLKPNTEKESLKTLFDPLSFHPADLQVVTSRTSPKPADPQEKHYIDFPFFNLFESFCIKTPPTDELSRRGTKQNPLKSLPEESSFELDKIDQKIASLLESYKALVKDRLKTIIKEALGHEPSGFEDMAERAVKAFLETFSPKIKITNQEKNKKTLAGKLEAILNEDKTIDQKHKNALDFKAIAQKILDESEKIKTEEGSEIATKKQELKQLIESRVKSIKLKNKTTANDAITSYEDFKENFTIAQILSSFTAQNEKWINDIISADDDKRLHVDSQELKERIEKLLDQKHKTPETIRVLVGGITSAIDNSESMDDYYHTMHDLIRDTTAINSEDNLVDPIFYNELARRLPAFDHDNPPPYIIPVNDKYIVDIALFYKELNTLKKELGESQRQCEELDKRRNRPSASEAFFTNSRSDLDKEKSNLIIKRRKYENLLNPLSKALKETNTKVAKKIQEGLDVFQKTIDDYQEFSELHKDESVKDAPISSSEDFYYLDPLSLNNMISGHVFYDEHSLMRTKNIVSKMGGFEDKALAQKINQDVARINAKYIAILTEKISDAVGNTPELSRFKNDLSPIITNQAAKNIQQIDIIIHQELQKLMDKGQLVPKGQHLAKFKEKIQAAITESRKSLDSDEKAFQKEMTRSQLAIADHNLDTAKQRQLAFNQHHEVDCENRVFAVALNYLYHHDDVAVFAPDGALPTEEAIKDEDIQFVIGLVITYLSDTLQMQGLDQSKLSKAVAKRLQSFKELYHKEDFRQEADKELGKIFHFSANEEIKNIDTRHSTFCNKIHNIIPDGHKGAPRISDQEFIAKNLATNKNRIDYFAEQVDIFTALFASHNPVVVTTSPPAVASPATSAPATATSAPATATLAPRATIPAASTTTAAPKAGSVPATATTATSAPRATIPATATTTPPPPATAAHASPTTARRTPSAAEEKQTAAKIDEYIDKDSGLTAPAKLQEIIEETLESQRSKPIPDKPYRGIGLLGEFNDENQIVISKIFSGKNPARFKDFTGGKAQEMDSSYSLKGQKISNIWDKSARDWITPTIESATRIAEIFHSKEDVFFKLADGKTITCSANDKEVFVTNLCESAKSKDEELNKEHLTAVSYQAAKHGSEAIDPEGKIQELLHIAPATSTTSPSASSPAAAASAVTASRR